MDDLLSILFVKENFAAFLGAFFSFFFMRIYELQKEAAEVKKGERRSLVRLERHLLFLIPSIHHNLDALRTIKSTLLAFSQQKFFDYVPNLFEVEMKMEYTEGIRDMEIVNDAMQFGVCVAFDQKNLSELRRQMERMWAQISSNMQDESIPLPIAAMVLKSTANLMKNIGLIEESMLETLKAGKRLQAEIRADVKRFSWLNDILYRPIFPDKKKREKEITDELSRMKVEEAEIKRLRNLSPIEGDPVFDAFKAS